MSTFYPPNIWYCNIFQHLIIRPQKDGKVKIRPKWWWFILFYHFGCYYKSIISHIPRQRGLRLPRSPRCLLRPGGSRRRVVKGRRRSGEGLCVAPALRRKWRGGFNGGRFISWKKHENHGWFISGTAMSMGTSMWCFNVGTCGKTVETCGV